MTTWERFVYRMKPAIVASFLKFISRIKRRELILGAHSFWIDPVSNFGVRLTSCGEYEPPMTQAICSRLKSGSTFVDIGSNEGYFSVLAASIVGPEGHIYAVEPQERLWPVILRNFAANRLFNYTLIPFALGKESITSEISLFPSTNSGASSLVPPVSYKSVGRQKCEIMTLDEMVDSYSIEVIDLAKIDVEGFEHDVVQGAQKALEKGVIRNVIMETHPSQLAQQGITVEEIEAIMREKGYDAQPLEEHSTIWSRVK